MENASPSLAHKKTQHRVIDGTLYGRHTEPYAFDIRVHSLGHGHTEATVLPRYGWAELGSLSPSALADYEASTGHIFVNGEWLPHTPTHQELQDKLACNRERSSRRAKTKVRRLCKAKGLTTLLTLTYQENVTDRSRMARDFDVFVKRVKRVVSDFEYVCVFERQKRGAWHAHIAVPRILSHYQHKGALVRSYDLLRSMWRGVIGAGGNIDVSRSKRVGRSSAKLAAYMSKYITKGFDGGDGDGDSYRASGRALDAAIVVRGAPKLWEAFMELMDLLSPEIAGEAHFHHALLDCGGCFVSISPK